MMECKHPYYNLVDGQLVCAQCGEPSKKVRYEDGNFVPIEDKVDYAREDKTDEEHEDKAAQIIPPEVRRQKKKHRR